MPSGQDLSKRRTAQILVELVEGEGADAAAHIFVDSCERFNDATRRPL
jgi:hypothetical protein